MEKNWRDAKIPKWVSESVESELRDYRVTASLAWPMEAKPTPLPFWWGDYDRLTGEPQEGVYWGVSAGHFVNRVEIKKNQDKTTRKKWLFKASDRINAEFSTSVYRGRFFATEREARLFVLWAYCQSYAKTLADLRSKL